MDRLSLRVRATLMGIAVTAIVVSLASVVLSVTLERQLTSAGDDLAQSRVRDLLSAAERGDLPADGQLRNVNDESLTQVVGPDGDVLASSANVAGSPAVVGVSALGVAEDQLVVATLDAPDDDETERYRIWAGRGPSPEGDVTVLVGTSLESVGEASATLRRSLLVGVPLVLGLLALAIWTVLGAALRRVDRITTTVAAIDEAELWRRVEESDVDDEVGRLARTMNRMLGRLESGARRQRAFVADASHDLQSPLTAMRADLEVALAHPEQVEMSALAHDLLAASGQMEEVVSDLLHLAVEDDAPHPDPALLDLDAIVLEEVARVRTGSRRRARRSLPSPRPPCSVTPLRYVGSCAISSTTPYDMPTPGSSWRSPPRPTVPSCSTSATTAPASRPTTGSGSSTASSAATPRARPAPAAAGSVWPSPAGSPNATTAP